MKNIVYFSICRYVPSLLRGESINIGFVYHVPALKKLGFYNSKNTRRIKAFDDELDNDSLNMIFESLEYDFNDSPDIYYNDDLNSDLADHTILQRKLYNYVNQVQFSEISVTEFEDSEYSGNLFEDYLGSTLNDLADIYLYYDKPKGSRIDHDRVKALTKKIIKATNYPFNIEHANKSEEFYTPPYDYKIVLDDKNIYLKGFSLDYTQQSRLYKEFKSYLTDLQYAIDHQNYDPADIKIITNNTNLTDSEEALINHIFPNNIEFLTLEKLGKYLTDNVGQYRDFCLV